jgi:hypothetical protein
MSDVNSESAKKLQEYSQQMGFDVLAPNEAIDTHAEAIYNESDDEDLEGSSDTQSRAKNPLFQYMAAAVMGTVLVGLPLSAFFSLGGGKTVAKTDTSETNQPVAATTADPEVDKLRTNIALDVQNPTANADTIAKPTPPQNPSESQIPTQKPKPVVAKPAPVVKAPSVASVPTPAIKLVTVAQVPKVVPVKTIAQPPAYRPVSYPKPQSVQITAVPKPQPARIATVPKPQPVQIAAATKPQVPTVAAQAPTPPMSYQEASALASYGGGDTTDNSALTLAAAPSDEQTLSPTLPLPLGTAVIGHTITPYNSISKGQSQGTSDVSVSIDQPIQLAQGYSLPVGTVVQFSVVIADNGLVQATSKGVYINNSAIKVPAGTFSITGSNSEALVAQQRAVRQDELASADTRTAIYGAAGTIGQVFTQAGNQTVLGSTGIGTVSGIQTNNPSPNIIAVAAQGAFQPLLAANQSRTAATTAEIQGLSRINTLPINTKVKLFVATPGVVQIPVTGVQTTSAQAPDTQPYQAMQVKPEALKGSTPGLQQDSTQQVNPQQTPVVRQQINSQQNSLVQPQVRQQTPVVQPQANYPQTPVVQPQVNQATSAVQPQQINSQPTPAVQPQVNQTTPVVQPQVNQTTPAVQPQQINSQPTPAVPQSEAAYPPAFQVQQAATQTPQPQQPAYPQVTTPQPQQPAYPQITN